MTISKNDRRKLRWKRHRRLAARDPRRGILLLVVLSMLVLFMLVGTAFLMVASNYRTGSKNQEKANRAAPQAGDLLERALRQTLRDTANQNSAIRYHSLLRDVYGTDGFVANVLNTSGVANTEHLTAQYSGAFVSGAPLGPTEGQLVDLFVRDRPATGLATSDDVLELELDANGLPVDFTLPRTDGYYNGCVLTILTGPAKGQSVRIIDYDCLNDNTAETALVNQISNIASGLPVFRLRVVAMPRTDGGAVALDVPATPTTNDLVGQTFMVNGRAMNGTGVGLNRLAGPGMPGLTALETIQLASNSQWVGIEPALTPNARYFGSGTMTSFNPAMAINPDPSHDNPQAAYIDASSHYTSYEGPGGSDESYDAADFQNMFLALMPLRPRERGRVVNSGGTSFDVDAYYDGTDVAAPARLDLDNVPIPSFHRPALVNFWLHRLYNAPWLSGLSEAERVRAILSPYNSTASAAVAAQIVAFKRKYTLRPLPEDHPNFDGSNPRSRYEGNLDLANLTHFINGSQITFPFWEATGPWDVDNDNDGVPDSIWVDLGMPVKKTEDGRLYKPLFAILIQDLDGRLNLNAHGSSEHLANKQLDFSADLNGLIEANLTDGVNHLGEADVLHSSNQLPHGSGWGVADVSLRPVLSPATSYLGDPNYDDYARLLFGRPSPNIATTATAKNFRTLWGRYGSAELAGATNAVNPGVTFNTVALSPWKFLDQLAQRKFSNYPKIDRARAIREGIPAVDGMFPPAITPSQLSGFGSSPDLKSSYGVGIDYTGQKVYESVNDTDGGTPMMLTVDAPYETNLSPSGRRGGVDDPSGMLAAYASGAPVNDDALFSPAELERLLRAFDADASRLPDRAWNVVDAFDPNKLVNTDTPTSGQLFQAQLQAAINRRVVTTDSFYVPATEENWSTRLALGADGLPGIGGVDDNNANGVDDMGELNWVGSDDYFNIMGVEPPENARLVDYLRYRIALELTKQNVPWTEQLVNQIIHGAKDVPATDVRLARASFGGLLAPEVLAGLKMDLNRPFGDGKDNNNNGIVDEPAEAGEPFIDSNDNGVWDTGEPYQELAGNAVYDPPLDFLWMDQNADGLVDSGERAEFDHANGQDANGRGKFIAGAVIKDDGRMARQLYARHLYCLALLLMDENYLAPYDPNDAQVVDYLDPDSDGSPANLIRVALAAGPTGYPAPGETGDPSLDARRRAMRKLTCRKIAQWAINCADQRDPDAIMTPFEYDENPWDGWNVVDSVNGQIYPIDGDVGTDENAGDYREVLAGGWNDDFDNPEVTAHEQTRGLVWGAERPELLMTETLALHDRRVEDLGEFTDPNEVFLDENGQVIDDPDDDGRNKKVGNNRGDDDDLDQRLRPQGTCFVELYNPTSEDGHKPAEIYGRRDLDGDGAGDTKQGVDLSRLSDASIDGTLQGHSPVWRIIAVEQHPALRSDERFNDDGAGARDFYDYPHSNGAKVYEDTSRFGDDVRGRFLVKPGDLEKSFTPPDPDFPTFDRDARPAVPQRATFRTITRSGNAVRNIRRVRLEIPRTYIERAFYFTSGANWDGDPQNLAVRIPEDAIDVDIRDVLGPTSNEIEWKKRLDELLGGITFADRFLKPEGIGRDGSMLKIYNFHFPPADTEDLDGDGEFIESLPSAPILPGRYAVVGSSGSQFYTSSGAKADRAVKYPGRFVTTLGRLQRAVNSNASGSARDRDHDNNLHRTRRIDLLPHPNPEVHQLLVDQNVGNESAGKVDLDGDGLFDTNVTDQHTGAGLLDGSGLPTYPLMSGNLAQQQIRPVVTLPIDGMSVTEPLDGYLLRWMELDPDAAMTWVPTENGGEGGFYNKSNDESGGFDVPFDLQRELVQNITSPNYRTLHLQRLANPLLPWNPTPDHMQHNSDAPVNPYLTVDSSSVDVTSFNGTDNKENDLPEPDQRGLAGKNQITWPEDLHLYRDYLPEDPQVPRTEITSREAIVMTLSSTARGFHSALVGAKDAPSARLVWQQERPNVLLDLETIRLNGTFKAADAGNRVHTLSGQKNTAFLDTYLKVDSTLWPDLHIVDYPLRHSLGFQNEQFDSFYTRTDYDASGGPPTGTEEVEQYDMNGDRVYGDLIGAPRTDLSNAGDIDDVTYPWLAWPNRPFASGMEILQAPAASSSQMLRAFSVANPKLEKRPNPYDGDGLVNPAGGLVAGNFETELPEPDRDPAGDPVSRREQTRGPFGHLLNVFQASSAPAQAPLSAPNAYFADETGNPVPTGAPNFSRLFDYVHVPSRFVATETTLNQAVFSPLGGMAPVTSSVDPRNALQAPFNRAPGYREPGRVNLNTVVGRQATPGNDVSLWSPVYDGLMHRDQDDNHYNSGTLEKIGHRGPAWRDVVLSRRGYVQPTLLSDPRVHYSPRILNPEFPTFFANPFRSASAGNLVPLVKLQHGAADASLLRSHPYSPGPDGAWGRANEDHNTYLISVNGPGPDGLKDDAAEAGLGDDSLLVRADGALPDSLKANQAGANKSPVVPLFSSTVREPALDGDRNAALRYMPLTRMNSMTSTRSGVFAIWITVGFFEVTPADDWNDPDATTQTAVRNRFNNNRNLYDRVYPDGYQLGQELGSETGDTHRHRGFWIVDRTLPVAFKPGDDVNVEKMILLERRVE